MHLSRIFLPDYRTIVLLLATSLAGCSNTPIKESDTENEYESLYSGTTNEKLANEAGIAATSPEAAIARGDDAYSQGQYDVALYEYVEALKLNGGDTETLNKVGDIHFTLGDLTNAGDAYDASLQLDPENQHALQGLGLIKLKSREYAKAKEHLVKAIEINDGLWHAYNGLGTIADIEGNHTDAVRYYERALQIMPRSALVLNNIGYSEYLSGDWQTAMMRFAQSVNIDPAFDRAWYNIGLIYTRQGNYEDAFVAFRNVLDTPEAYNDIGYISMMDGHYDIARSYFEKAVKTSPSYYLKAHENIYKLERLRERGPAVAYYRSSESRDPSDRLRSAVTETTSDRTGNSDSPVRPAEVQESILVTTPDSVASATALVLTDSLTPDVTDNPKEILLKQDVSADTSDALKESPAAVTNDHILSTPSGSSTVNGQDATAVDANIADIQLGLATGAESLPSPNINSDTSTVLAPPGITSTESTTKSSKDNPDHNEHTGYYTKSEQSEYRKALAQVRDGEFKAAAESFTEFLETFPDSSYAANANYWIGETYYVTRDFKPALKIFGDLITNFPDSPKVPDTRLKIGYIHYEQNEWAAAQQTLTGIVSDYPDSEVAQLANARLMRMEDEGHLVTE